MKCPKCNEEIKEGSIICPYCGNKIEDKIDDKKEDKKKDKKWGLVIGCSAIISALIILSINSELPLEKFIINYIGAFVVVFFFLSIIYIVFRK